MPVISDAASVVKSRFGFHNPLAEALPLRSPADVPKSASKDNLHDPPFIQYPHSTEVPVETSNQSFKLSDDPSFWEDHNVQVIIRIRPLSNSEVSVQGYRKCTRQDSSQTITWTGHPDSRFTFDVVADENVSQEKLFMVAGIPMVDNCISGYNSCMFAYGQTGSGKTHTMLGDIEGGTRRHNVNCGMTPRVFDHLFTRIQKEKEARQDEKLKYTCKCSFLEIYNEQILDLLDPSSTNLQIREDTRKGVYVENLKVIEVTSARDVMQQLLQGAANRKVAATNMNRASSRSHSVFTCTIESSWEAQGVSHHRFARLNLVDLAGSERQKSTGAEGERLKEATNINKSLSTLGLVIMNLVNVSNGKSLHVPYRDSKLTFLLQDSLGGNSKTIMIANISPSICCSLETLSTLKFAQRAKFIKNDAIVNEDASGDVVAMRVQIQQMKKEIAYLRSSVNGKTEYQESELSTMSIPGSPTGSKCEGLQESFSPFLLEKKASHKEDFDIALVGAFKREKEKNIELETLIAENQAAMKLLKEREVEIQGLKMRLRFREDAKKRLEAVQSRDLSVESHMLKEKEELLKEMEILRVQADRNQEVTRFAMENLRLKEDIRRLKSFCEEGEREMLNQQIMVLENKLLDALDWKLMHEADIGPSSKKNSDLREVSEDVDLQISSQTAVKQVSPWHTAAHQENEFLHLQAIENQSEIDSLHQKLNLCSQEKEKLEMSVNELSAMLEQERSTNLREPSVPSVTAIVSNLDRQKELNTMVEAIAAASLREAEAHEAAIALSKENDELRKKMGVLIDDNNKLIDLYEQAAAETRNSSAVEANEANEIENEVTEMKNVIKNLEHQLTEMHEENEKLLGLYEKAMQERDEFKRMFTSANEEAEFQKVDLIRFTGDTALAREKLHIIEDGISTTAARVLRHSLSSLSSTIVHFEEREAQAKARAHTAFSYVDHKKEELRKLHSRKNEIEKSIMLIRKTDAEARTHLGSLKMKFKEANKMHENRKVLFAIDNMENGTERNWQLDVTATELLMVEEENTKLQNEMNKCREKMIMLKKELENANKKYQHVVSMIDVVEKELQVGSESAGEAELALESVIKEKKMLLEFQENAKPKLDNLVFEYIECILQADLRSEEGKIVEDVIEAKEMEAYGSRRYSTDDDIKQLSESRDSSEISRIIEELETAMNCVDELKYLLEN